MAYLNFSEVQGGPVTVPGIHAARPASGFTALEWQVVAIARQDRLSTLEAPGRMSVALGAVFGGKRANPRLADARLEALRRVSVLAWHRGYTLPPSEIRAFHDAGFTADQYETLLASISAGRSARNRGH